MLSQIKSNIKIIVSGAYWSISMGSQACFIAAICEIKTFFGQIGQHKAKTVEFKKCQLRNYTTNNQSQSQNSKQQYNLSNNKNYTRQPPKTMQNFMQNLPQIKKRIEHGTSMCPQKQYPFMMFKCGLLFTRLSDINKVISFMEAVEFLKAENKLTETLECHLVNFLYERPELYGRVLEIVEGLIRNKSVNVLIQLEKLEEIPKPQPSKANVVNGNHRQDAPSSNTKTADSIPIVPQPQKPLTKTANGTMIMEQNSNPVNNNNDDNDSEKTEKYDDQYFDNIMKMNLESEALAKKLQEEEEMLAKSHNVGDDTVCQVCYVGLYDEQFLPLETCEHIFHKNCLSQYFKAEISQNRFPLKCPSDKCGQQVKDSDIKQILASELYTKYQKHTLKHYADMHGDSISWCPTANCEYMFFFEKDDEVRFQCLECKKEYCLNCRVEWHKDMTCKEYKISNTTSADDEAFMKFVKGKKFKQCPKCKFWVEKNEGCDHMTCKCKFEFCYKCGGVYMKCQCVAKMQEEMERRRQQIAERRKKKLENQQKRKKKAEEQAPAPQRSRRKRK